MSDPALAGYNPSSSLIQAVGGVSIKPMMGGAQLQGSDVKDVKLFSKVYKLPNPESFADDASLNANEDIKQIMTTLRFSTFPFLEKKKILKAIYDSNCSNETDLALDCGCDPVRKVIADLATILLEKTAASGPIDVVKKASSSFVEISIRIPIDKINVIMGKSSSPAAGKKPYEWVKGENDIPTIAALKQKVKDEKDEAKRKLLELELEAERSEFAAKQVVGTEEENEKKDHAVSARKKFTDALAASKSASAPAPAAAEGAASKSVSAVASEAAAPAAASAAAASAAAASSQNIQANQKTMWSEQATSGTKPVFIKTAGEEQQGATAPRTEEPLRQAENMAGGNQSRKLRRGN